MQFKRNLRLLFPRKKVYDWNYEDKFKTLDCPLFLFYFFYFFSLFLMFFLKKKRLFERWSRYGKPIDRIESKKHVVLWIFELLSKAFCWTFIWKPIFWYWCVWFVRRELYCVKNQLLLIRRNKNISLHYVFVFIS